MTKDEEIESLFPSYPTYQYSVFLKNGRDEQIVIRTATFEELLEAKKNINKILEKVEEEQVSITPIATPTFCSLHNYQMKERVAPDGSLFYSHGKKNPDGSFAWCSGKGFHWKNVVATRYSVTGEPRTQCPKCGAWKPAEFRLCWNCWSKQPAKKNIKK